MSKNKVEIKKFLDVDVRVIDGELVVLKDIFTALDRLDTNNKITTRDRDKVRRLQEYGVICGSTKCTVTSNSIKLKARATQEVECLKLCDMDLLATQFEPSKNSEALPRWIEFMKFVGDLLSSLEVYKYIVTDKEKQKEHIARITDMNGSAMIANKQVNKIMGELLGVEGSISKDELKQYQAQTTIDLLEVREMVLDKFATAFEFTGSHSKAKEMAFNLAIKKYPFDVSKSA